MLHEKKSDVKNVCLRNVSGEGSLPLLDCDYGYEKNIKLITIESGVVYT
jgi:hypothetical protein